MIVEHKFYVGLRDINLNNELTNTGFLACLEDVACMHSEIAGYGVLNIEKTKRTWILLNWKIEILKRPKYNETITVKTWSRKIDKYNAFRDFNIFGTNNELIAKASSKWFFIDIEKGKPIKISDEVAECYKQEDIAVFDDDALNKLQDPGEYISSINYKITKNMIDINNHLHNIYYMDIAEEALPENIKNEFNNFEIMYKKEVKLGDTVKAYYSKVDNYHYITIKSEDEKFIHSIIRFK